MVLLQLEIHAKNVIIFYPIVIPVQIIKHVQYVKIVNIF